MRFIPYLNFNGQCEAAFKFYEQVFGGKIEMMMSHGDSPIAEHVPPEWHKSIMHARLSVGDQVLMGSDAPPDRFETARGLWVSIVLDDVAVAERIFNSLAENGTIQMPFEETFWAARFGMVIDRFGTPWMLNCELRAV
jgi:PhnB protein